MVAFLFVSFFGLSRCAARGMARLSWAQELSFGICCAPICAPICAPLGPASPMQIRRHISFASRGAEPLDRCAPTVYT
jgi:hypothetical protein